jgi:catechol 2,3-dioxygenase
VSKYLSHLSHVEVTTPDVEASVQFYEDIIGLRTIARRDGKVFLRAWGDYYLYSLVISEGPEPSMATMAWRTASADALQEAVARIEQAGVQGTWSDSGYGHGPAYSFVGPFGHTMELYWEVERYKGTNDLASRYPDRPERRGRHGVAPRQLDHVTIAASDVRAFASWYRDVLDFRVMAYTTLENSDLTVFSVLTTNEKSHDLGIVLDGSTLAGRVNHFAFWVDTHEELLVGADILMENGTDIEYGPSIHGIGEQSFLYFREPSSLRIELNTGGYRNYVPDWEPNEWKPSMGSNNFYRNGVRPTSMAEAFPPADGPSATEEGVLPGTEALFLNPYGAQGLG